MKQPNRLPAGGRIDRRALLDFTFNGKSYIGYAGDTLASALLANGISIVGRSFKYRRPRGIVGSGAEEPNAIVQIGTGPSAIPNPRATQTELYRGLVASSVNCWPGPEFDAGSLFAGMLGPLFPAGFYYKTFMWPQSLWMKYEHFIRKAAGLGTAPTGPDPDYYARTHAHCDVLIAGAGPAGLAAALAAGRSGARVMIADEQNEFGGGLLASRELLNGAPTGEWLAATLAELAGMDNVQLMPRSTVFAYYDHNFVCIVERVTDHLPPGASKAPRQRLWWVRAKQIVLATGSIERPLVFGNNDRPGVMLASAVSAYVNRYAVAPGSRAIVFTNNDSAYQTALDLTDAGAIVSAVVDARPEGDGELVAQVKDRGIEIIAGHAVVDVTAGRHVQAARVMRLNGGGDAVSGAARAIECNLLAVSGGWSPAVHLHAQSGGKPWFDDDRACFVPGEPVQAERSAGACNGVFSLGECLREGAEAGFDAACAAGKKSSHEKFELPGTAELRATPLMPLWVVPHGHVGKRGSKQFVDFQNDTTAADIALATREGYQSIEHVKRYTALGFGTDQGKLGNINGMAIVAKSLGNDISATGTTTFRPAYTPVTFGAIAGQDVGELFDAVRTTPMHQWHLQHGARFENVGQWKRPWYYPRKGETMQEAVNRECRATRDSVGVMDASTLGKIDIQGPDAVELLNWVYTNAWDKLEIGRCRYGLMLGEDGMVMDDGVTSRLGENHYLMTTTTGGAASVVGWLERWLQTEWPDMRVYLTSVTEQWATISIAGPDSRELIASVCDDIDFAADVFPFMSFREGTVAGVAARVFRISFSGELSFEINVPANHARHVW
ncbi:MAG: sarcosine oxidase subunit alpha family protein, partial [Gammaproteobacteria bacterium]